MTLLTFQGEMRSSGMNIYLSGRINNTDIVAMLEGRAQSGCSNGKSQTSVQTLQDKKRKENVNSR